MSAYVREAFRIAEEERPGGALYPTRTHIWYCISIMTITLPALEPVLLLMSWLWHAGAAHIELPEDIAGQMVCPPALLPCIPRPVPIRQGVAASPWSELRTLQLLSMLPR